MLSLPSLSFGGHMAMDEKSVVGGDSQGEHIMSKEDLADTHIIGQVDHKFVCCFAASMQSIALVDQHACGERIELEKIFEALAAGCHDDKLLSTAVLSPAARVLLTPGQHAALVKYQTLVSKWRFHVDVSSAAMAPDGSIRVKVHSVPKVASYQAAPEELPFFLQYLETQKEVHFPFPVPHNCRKQLVYQACRRAIKFGDPLTDLQQADLLTRIKQCKYPFQCAHGRPTVYPLFTLDGPDACAGDSRHEDSEGKSAGWERELGPID
ncbi:unnamed protein product [Vitrella brassicaformis CCMP3155]|uniref:MutL C-terminal dimerisation domain-containing protein n=1 Tax=Vitrella brassicaformis (strain CCMP3155) TaxID=1169540 RepID=A0A0G4H7J3_VITBC|nr:unnamed protein product [Vitrella brassicaformis CCMP3155]|eukprot:CEM39638.1 unnamed protein product [Vitrella brassicaformis CCMP3155]